MNKPRWAILFEFKLSAFSSWNSYSDCNYHFQNIKIIVLNLNKIFERNMNVLPFQIWVVELPFCSNLRRNPSGMSMRPVFSHHGLQRRPEDLLRKGASLHEYHPQRHREPHSCGGFERGEKIVLLSVYRSGKCLLKLKFYSWFGFCFFLLFHPLICAENMKRKEFSLESGRTLPNIFFIILEL